MPSVNVLPFELPGFEIESVEEYNTVLTIEAQSTAPSAACPLCGQRSTRVHSYYLRSPGDLPCCGLPVRLKLQVRRFRCIQPDCPRKTFAERLPLVVAVHAQRTSRLTARLRALAFELGGKAGARAAQQVEMAASRDTLLRLIRKTETPPVVCPPVLGVDDWAYTRGVRYGTLVVDMERHQAIDVLPDRTAQTLATWLKAHPGAQIVCRDRSKEYQAGISQGAPQAIQVADRWHLLRNLGDAVQRVLARHPDVLRAVTRTATETGLATPPPSEEPTAPSAPVPQRQVQPTYRHQVFAEVKARIAQGESNRTIARQLHLHRQTVARYRQLEGLPQRTTPQNRSSVAPYLPDLRQRWAEGEHNGKQLWRELSAKGYTGSYMSVHRALKHFSDYPPRQPAQASIQPTPPALSPRQAMWLLVREPARLTAEQVIQRQALCEQCSDAAIVYPLAQRFVAMIKQRRVDELDSWLKDALTCGISTFRHFVVDLKQDYAAVKAALSFEWSNGQLEGQVNRLKYLKRQMYGRAKFDLLRLRVLRPP